MRCLLPALALLASFGLAACDRRLEPYVAQEDEPPRANRPVRVPGLETPMPRSATPLPELAMPTDPAGAPPGMPPGTRMGGDRLAPADAERGAPITGSIRLEDPALAGRSGVLFLIARGEGGGPPLAVRRLPAGPFPLDFEIGPEHVMIPGRPFAGPIQLSARLDADGDAMTRSETDLASALVPGLEPGATGVELVLRRP